MVRAEEGNRRIGFVELVFHDDIVQRRPETLRRYGVISECPLQPGRVVDDRDLPIQVLSANRSLMVVWLLPMSADELVQGRVRAGRDGRETKRRIEKERSKQFAEMKAMR